MTNRRVETSPQIYARTGGALYLIIIALGIFGEVFVRGKLIISGNSVATAANITSMELLWRWGIVSEVLALICTITLAMVYFVLLNPVNKNLNLLATFFRMISIVIQGVAVLHLAEALFPLGDVAFQTAFSPEQLDILTNLAIKSHSYGFSFSLLILGCCFLIHGYLIFKSSFLPKALGVMIVVAGLGYLTNGFTLLLAPALEGQIFQIIVLPVFLGELSLSLWLLIKGVNVEKWKNLSPTS
jgi:hypothetical protein